MIPNPAKMLVILIKNTYIYIFLVSFSRSFLENRPEVAAENIIFHRHDDDIVRGSSWPIDKRY
ncbi:hypothetical protein DSCO28_45590 [Desulfosarcina ovata subsp. sediminis]|uniref:Uncharacterized protein n=1 Tax=Desulfosarcina ovata subsp. sediminis TaxID=885957 RepID=A0A5K7ZUS5_9BACT|nr:hypothetical protein DSCO28_45590 [Desulfosarcina ovata subsp. sediminis]